ncbi:12467_t:CDS:1 [Funneliformis mosseae]|uniref:12467_t:CDS:1 n=1 Tax=Funneliformis mosseae TaxID=27381 RepID=A0A9N9BCA9_FUNMO|nr:12467_t:CDS:1 [Funneliformis mosseae]
MKANETSTSSSINILPTETPMSRLLIKPFDKRYSTQLIIDKNNVLERQTFTFLLRKRKRTAIFQHVITLSGDDFRGNFNNSEDSDSNSLTENNERDVRNNAEFLNNFEDYSHSVFNLPTVLELLK